MTPVENSNIGLGNPSIKNERNSTCGSAQFDQIIRMIRVVIDKRDFLSPRLELSFNSSGVLGRCVPVATTAVISFFLIPPASIP